MLSSSSWTVEIVLKQTNHDRYHPPYIHIKTACTCYYRISFGQRNKTLNEIDNRATHFVRYNFMLVVFFFSQNLMRVPYELSAKLFTKFINQNVLNTLLSRNRQYTESCGVDCRQTRRHHLTHFDLVMQNQVATLTHRRRHRRRCHFEFQFSEKIYVFFLYFVGKSMKNIETSILTRDNTFLSFVVVYYFYCYKENWYDRVQAYFSMTNPLFSKILIFRRIN